LGATGCSDAVIEEASQDRPTQGKGLLRQTGRLAGGEDYPQVAAICSTAEKNGSSGTAQQVAAAGRGATLSHTGDITDRAKQII
jgi:hypothetical protein